MVGHAATNVAVVLLDFGVWKTSQLVWPSYILTPVWLVV